MLVDSNHNKALGEQHVARGFEISAKFLDCLLLGSDSIIYRS